MLHTSCWPSAGPPSFHPELWCGRQVMEGLAQWVGAGMLAQPQARAAVLGLFAALGALFHAAGERRLVRRSAALNMTLFISQSTKPGACYLDAGGCVHSVYVDTRC